MMSLDTGYQHRLPNRQAAAFLGISSEWAVLVGIPGAGLWRADEGVLNIKAI